jgi:hypothetical protein
MTFMEASAFRLPEGPHKGERVDDVARAEGGLRHLDTLRNEAEPGTILLLALCTYLEDPGIRRQMEFLE